MFKKKRSPHMGNEEQNGEKRIEDNKLRYEKKFKASI